MLFAPVTSLRRWDQCESEKQQQTQAFYLYLISEKMVRGVCLVGMLKSGSCCDERQVRN